MRFVRKLLVGVAATTLSTTAAMAADPIFIPPPAPQPPVFAPAPVMDWTGPYIGLILGYGMGEKFWDFAAYPGPLTGTTTTHPVRGFLAGVEAGFRFGLGGLVIGAEGDWAWTNINGSGPCGGGGAETCATDLDWIATATGQIGFGAGNILPYFEGGFAWADENFTASGGAIVTPMTATLINRGWVLGGGVVLAMGPGLYIKGEYNFINFGTDGPITLDDGAAGTQDFDLTQRLHIFKLGIGFMF